MVLIQIHGQSCLWKGAELSRDNSARAELSWAELSVGRVVCPPVSCITRCQDMGLVAPSSEQTETIDNARGPNARVWYLRAHCLYSLSREIALTDRQNIDNVIYAEWKKLCVFGQDGSRCAWVRVCARARL